MSQSKQSTRDLIESIVTETPIEFYDQALAQHRRLRKDIQSLIDESMCTPDEIAVIHRVYEGYSLFPYSDHPKAVHESLKSLEALADSLDRKHGAALKSFAIAAISELANCLDVDEISESELLTRLRRLKKDCEQSLAALKRKRDSLRQEPSADGMTREKAIAMMKKTYDELLRTNPESDMETLVNTHPEAARFVKQIDWMDILGVWDRTIRKWSVWQRLSKSNKERRVSLKSTLPGGDDGSATDDAEDE